MKTINFLLGTLAVAGVLGFSQSAVAQENGNRDENGKIVRGPYETNGFWSNWFIGVGAGANTVLGHDGNKNAVDFGLGGLATEVNVGKWFTPSVGARVGWKGLQNSYTIDGTSADFNQHYFHADALWNISNALSGYKETRFWDFIPYATFGVMDVAWASNDNDWEYAGGAGLLNDLRLSNHVDLFVDVAALVAYGHQYEGGRFSLVPSVTAGLIFNLGRTNFDRHSSVSPVVVPLPFTTEQYNALKNRVAELEKENAALKSEIEALKNRKPETVYVEKNTVDPVSRTFFDLGSSMISAREKAHLDYFAEQVIKQTDKVYTVTGYADAKTGSATTNQKLSEARANAVKDYLVKKGVDASRLNVVGAGATLEFSEPVSSNRTVVIR